MQAERSRLVYSTDQAVSRPGNDCKKKSDGQLLRTTVRPAQQRVTVRLDRKARGGKTVTVIEGLQMPPQRKEEFLRQLKARLGTGGTVKGAGVEIQGDHRNALMAALEEMGYRPKRSGG